MKRSSSEADKAVLLRQRAQGIANKGNLVKAFSVFLDAAKLGDEESQVAVAYDYAYGVTGNVDVHAALKWWKRAYKQRSWDAAFNLGMFYRDARQWTKAMKWFERAVELGDYDGLVEIAKIHLRYGGDRDSGLRFLKRARAAKKHLTAQARADLERLVKEEEARSPADLLYMKAILLDEKGRYSEALPLLLKGVEAGDDSAMILLGNYLADGRKGIPVDHDRAVSLYKQAFAQGADSGAHNLGMHYRKLGNLEEAYKWFELAANAGDNGAHLALAKIWLHDRKNAEKAIEHLEAVFHGEHPSVSEADRDEARSMLRRLSMESKSRKRRRSGPSNHRVQ